MTSLGFELSTEARAQADLKFTYVVSCQIYGQQRQRKAPEAADISLLLQRYGHIYTRLWRAVFDYVLITCQTCGLSVISCGVVGFLPDLK